MSEKLSEFPTFMNHVMERLKKGAHEYGEQSFAKSPMELAEEIDEEIYDINGWSFVLWRRMDRVKAKIAALNRSLSLLEARVREFDG